MTFVMLAIISAVENTKNLSFAINKPLKGTPMKDITDPIIVI